jgi:hypothetical protein
VVAALVAAQKKPPTPPAPGSVPTPTSDDSPSGPGTDADPPPGLAGDAPTAPEPGTDAAAPPDDSAGPEAVSDQPVSTTAAVASRIAGGLLIGLPIVAVLAGLGAVLGRTSLRQRGLQWPRRP